MKWQGKEVVSSKCTVSNQANWSEGARKKIHLMRKGGISEKAIIIF